MKGLIDQIRAWNSAKVKHGNPIGLATAGWEAVSEQASERRM